MLSWSNALSAIAALASLWAVFIWAYHLLQLKRERVPELEKLVAQLRETNQRLQNELDGTTMELARLTQNTQDLRPFLDQLGERGLGVLLASSRRVVENAQETARIKLYTTVEGPLLLNSDALTAHLNSLDVSFAFVPGDTPEHPLRVAVRTANGWRILQDGIHDLVLVRGVVEGTVSFAHATLGRAFAEPASRRHHTGPVARRLLIGED